MNKILHVLLIFCFCFTIISCANNDSTSTTTSRGLHVRVSNEETIQTSLDGTTWISKTSVTTGNLWGVVLDQIRKQYRRGRG